MLFCLPAKLLLLIIKELMRRMFRSMFINIFRMLLMLFNKQSIKVCLFSLCYTQEINIKYSANSGSVSGVLVTISLEKRKLHKGNYENFPS